MSLVQALTREQAEMTGLINNIFYVIFGIYLAMLILVGRIYKLKPCGVAVRNGSIRLKWNFD
jgi:hypothetical protein